MLAIKPVKSPMIPPPIPITKSVRLKFLEKSLFKKKLTELRDFTFSLGIKSKLYNSYFFKLLAIFF